MKKYYGIQCKRLAALMLCIVMMSSMLLGGCGKYDQVISVEEASTSVVMVIGNYSVTMNEMYLYLIQYVYNYALKAEDLQTTDAGSVINAVAAEMKLEYVEYQLAIETGIELTEDQKQQAKASAAAFTAYFGETFLNCYGVTATDVDALFERQMYITAITDKATEDMAKDYFAQYEEEYADLIFTNVYYALFPSIQYDANGEAVVDANGNHVTLTADEMATQLASATELQSRAVAGESMETLVQEYGIEYCSGIEKNYVGAYSEELNTLIANLEVGQISDVIETPAGYMVVRMDNKNDTEYREYMIQSLSYQAAGALLPTMQENWVNSSGAANVVPNADLIATIDLVKLCEVMNSNGLVFNTGEQNVEN